MYKVPMALAPVLYIPGLLYEVFVRCRNRMYAAEILPQHRLPNPVISIGNITLGGTGKTPLVIYVAAALSKLGFTPAVLTRGYGRTRPGAAHVLAPGEKVATPALTLGDEPALIRRHVPSCWMGVSKERFAAGMTIAERDPGVVFVLDDGFQHRQLARDLDIVIIDSSRPLGSDYVFPRGTLREPLSALHRCNVIVINGSLDSAETRSIETEIRIRRLKAQVFHCSQFIQSLVPLPVWQRPETATPEYLSAPKHPDSRIAGGKEEKPPSAYLVSAIGNPQRFRQDIQRIGFAGPGGTSFADHYRLTRKDWLKCVEEARRKGADTIVTTEKDAVKLSEPLDFPLQVAEQSTALAEANAFECVLKKTVEDFR